MSIVSFNHYNLKGFTLIELIISMAIMSIMSVVLLARYPEAVKRLTLSNITHTVALTVHEAQVRGSAVDSINSTLGGYGVYLSLADPDKIILFGDRIDLNGVISPYQVPVGDGLYQNIETKATTTLPLGYTIAKLCSGTGTIFTCNSTNIPAITSLTISFIRPSPQANIYINNLDTNSISAGCIEFHSLLAPLPGHVRSVQVFSSGIIRRVNSGCE